MIPPPCGPESLLSYVTLYREHLTLVVLITYKIFGTCYMKCQRSQGLSSFLTPVNKTIIYT